MLHASLYSFTFGAAHCMIAVCVRAEQLHGGQEPGCTHENKIASENDAHTLNLAAKQVCCSQDSHSVVPSQSRKMAVSESLKELGKRSQSKAGTKAPANSPHVPGSQPSIMKFFRRD